MKISNNYERMIEQLEKAQIEASHVIFDQYHNKSGEVNTQQLSNCLDRITTALISIAKDLKTLKENK